MYQKITSGQFTEEFNYRLEQVNNILFNPLIDFGLSEGDAKKIIACVAIEQYNNLNVLTPDETDIAVFL